MEFSQSDEETEAINPWNGATQPVMVHPSGNTFIWKGWVSSSGVSPPCLVCVIDRYENNGSVFEIDGSEDSQVKARG